MKITFWGATEGVTGSQTFVHLPEGIIMVDCGLVQGDPESEKINERPFPFDPREIKALLLTHAHLDHSGLIPRLVKQGFVGEIYCTSATAQLVKVILEDSASLDKNNFYDEKDVSVALSFIKQVEWNEWRTLYGGQIAFFPAGHILGASSIKIKDAERTLVFSGDLGRKNDPIIFSPDNCPKASAVIMESTYGGKKRSGEAEKELYSFLIKISRESRVGIIASFAVARGQMLITLIHEFFNRHPEERFRVVVDSPMMVEANKVYQRFSHLTKVPHELKASLSRVETIDYSGQWQSLSKKHGPLLILSSSGMLTGGRIKRHLVNWQDDEKAILFLPGYQAEGTPGRAFIDGERNFDEVHWKGEVLSSEAFSSHADQEELLDWVSDLDRESTIFLIHGEVKSKEAFKQKLSAQGFTHVQIPKSGETYTL